MLRIDHPLILPLVPRDVRDQVLLLWRLDARLADLAHAGREPALRLIRLRWWADRLAELDKGAPAEPLLQEAHDLLLAPLGPDRLASLAEAWFEHAGESHETAAPAEALFRLTSELLSSSAPAGSPDAARLWSDVARLLQQGDAADWGAVAQRAPSVGIAGWPRPLAALAGLARAIALRRGKRSPGREQWLLLRIGLFGR